MAITHLLASPSVALVGQTVQLSPIGSASSALELRWYLSTAPPDSKLLTLATYEAEGKKRLDARLKPNAGGASFVPDVPGLYEVYLYPTTLYRFKRGYQGAVPAAGELAELDNETESLPAYAGSTAAVTPVGASVGTVLSVRVAQERKRTFGKAPDNATLTLRFRANATIADVPELDADGATLTAGTGAAAKIAVSSPDVLSLISLIDVSDNIATDMAISYASIASAIAIWNVHVGYASAFDTHGAADATNTIVSADATNLATSITLLNELRTKYAAHRILTAGSVHASPDAAFFSIVTAPAATDLDSAFVLWGDLYSRMNNHAGSATPHTGGVAAPVDGAANEQIEAPITEAMLPTKCNVLKTFYGNHIDKTTNAAPHDNIDAQNVVLVQMSSAEGIAGTVNAWADAIERHSRNQKADGTAAASAYHMPGGTAKSQDIKIPERASAQDVASIIRTAELCFVAFEQHALSTDVSPDAGLHGSKAWGSPAFSSFPMAPWYSVRLAKAWSSATKPITAPSIPNTNSADLTLVLLQGWTLEGRAAVDASAVAHGTFGAVIRAPIVHRGRDLRRWWLRIGPTEHDALEVEPAVGTARGHLVGHRDVGVGFVEGLAGNVIDAGHGLERCLASGTGPSAHAGLARSACRSGLTCARPASAGSSSLATRPRRASASARPRPASNRSACATSLTCRPCPAKIDTEIRRARQAGVAGPVGVARALDLTLACAGLTRGPSASRCRLTALASAAGLRAAGLA